MEARITRTCKLLFAGLLVTAGPAHAVRTTEASPLTSYMRARAADAAGMPEMAAAQYGAVLASEPQDIVLATRAYRQAVMGGDRALASRAARILDKASALPPDGRLLLLAEQVVARDWAGARASVDLIEREQAFAFILPVIRAWIAQGSGVGDPFAFLKASNVLGSAYGSEHRVLLSLARGDLDGATSLVKTAAGGTGIRDLRLRILVAQARAASGDKDGALQLLGGDDPALAVMRARLDQPRRSAPAQIDAAFGLSELLIRIAADLNRERVTPLSPALARIATFLAPGNAEAWLAAGQMLAMSNQTASALTVLEQVPTDDPLWPAARSTRIRILLRQEAKAEALALNQSVVESPAASVADWTLQGDILTSMDRHEEAAAAYGKAIALVGPDKTKDERLWSLWLMQGGAYEQADRWPEAKAALEKAYRLAPDQAVVLNYLGYSQLARRENIPAARALIEKAATLNPDDAAITDSLGWAYFLEGDLAAAIAKLEVAAEGDPGGSEINEHLGDAYWAAGRWIEARYAWRAALVNADATSRTRIDRKIDLGPEEATSRP